jgi:hypothetical protein
MPKRQKTGELEKAILSWLFDFFWDLEFWDLGF